MSGTPVTHDRIQGPGRVILALYVVFVIGSVSRSTAQIVTRYDQAPLAYTLSAVAAAIYVVATIALALPGPRAWLVSTIAISIELLGVISVGTWSLLQPERFADASVWSHYGQGYLFIPLVLPILGLWWLFRSRARQPSR
ncbi:MAG: hypothetical protein WBG57_04640 [Ornithinimicrobium sp.]